MKACTRSLSNIVHEAHMEPQACPNGWTQLMTDWLSSIWTITDDNKVDCTGAEGLPSLHSLLFPCVMQSVIWGQTMLVCAHNDPLLICETSAMSQHPALGTAAQLGDRCHWEGRDDLGS